ncbi:LRR and dual specificity phosphatase domain-containing protein [Naegleria gruberi]|uniref:protein-tyrosine-phosphatase n=1 Tax=Naegleria gruberi TaxID=5762 RepID=D2V2L6_NAEGR|nr:LRR and dual specificity phosphatase domain-containing protein [Naegleria gruberi]EFC48918.1 LRR and dual specificity phosphatase domain-containing protein [Naegleria gruberi]|eukprot:XP_002681662.1 LRR and dual specificity phosphatase domain-containing protein [Naegleria gruberi strain NEG-M]
MKSNSSDDSPTTAIASNIMESVRQHPSISLTTSNNGGIQNQLSTSLTNNNSNTLSPLKRNNMFCSTAFESSGSGDGDLFDFELRSSKMKSTTSTPTTPVTSNTRNNMNFPISSSTNPIINNQQVDVTIDHQPNKEAKDESDYGVNISDTSSTMTSLEPLGAIIFEQNSIEELSFEGKQLNDETFLRGVTLNIDKGVIINLQNQLQNHLQQYSLNTARPIAADDPQQYHLRALQNVKELNLSENQLYRFPFSLFFLNLPSSLLSLGSPQHRKNNDLLLPNITKLDISRNILKVSRIESILKKQKNFEKILEKERKEYLKGESSSSHRKVSLSLFKNQENKDSNLSEEDHRSYRYESLKELKMNFNQLKVYPLFVHTFFPRLAKLDLSFNHLNSESIELSENRNSKSLQTMFEKERGVKQKKLGLFNRKNQHNNDNSPPNFLSVHSGSDVETSPVVSNIPTNEIWSPNTSANVDEKIFTKSHSNPINPNTRFFEAGTSDPSLTELDLSSNLFKNFPISLKLRNLRILKLNKNVQMNPMAEKSNIGDVSKKEMKLLAESSEKGFDFDSDLHRVCKDNLPNLEYLEMVDCKFVTFPSNILCIEPLKTLIFDKNPFGAGSLQHRSQQIVQKVKILSKDKNTSPNILEKISDDSDINDSLLRGFPDLTQIGSKFSIGLTKLSVNSCRLNLEQDLPRILKFLPTLKCLKASNNLFKGKIDSTFEVYSNIEDLDLSNNYLQGFSFNIFPNAKLINLENNKICEEITWIPNSIISFNLQNNLFSGDLEKIISKCTGLEELIVSKNNFTSLPLIDNFPLLRSYKVSENKISLSQFPLLASNNFDMNNLEAVEIANHGILDIPSEFFTRCSNVSVLDLSSNFIRSIPSEIARLTKLTHLYLKYNEISDLVEESFMTLASLKYIEAKQNSKRVSQLIESDSNLHKWLVDHSIDISENSFKEPDLIEPTLYLGCKQSSSHYSTLKNIGITHILTIASEFNPRFHDREYSSLPDFTEKLSFIESSHEFVTKHVKMKETQNTDLIATFEECLPFIEEGTDQSQGPRKILIHCHVGINRSASIVIMYLMKKNQWTLNESLKFVRDKRPIVLPMPEFVKQLKQYNIQLRKERKKDSGVGF